MSTPGTIVLRNAALTDRASSDDLPEDNVFLFAPGISRTVAVERGNLDPAYRRAILALESAAGCRTVGGDEAAAFAAVASEPRKLPDRGLLLLAPSSPVGGLIEVGAETMATDARIVSATSPLPEISIAGLGAFPLRPAMLPPEHVLLAVAKTADGKSAPLVATWRWTAPDGRERTVAYLAALPKAWTAQPGFPVMIAELFERMTPRGPGLPGLAESDNRLPGPATTVAPALYAGKPRSRTVPLGRVAAALAAVCGMVVLAREWRRTRRRVTAG